MTPRETVIERHLKKRVRNLGGTTRKVKWLGFNGAPDRLVLLPSHGRNALVELKRPRGKPEGHQTREHQRLRAAGFEVQVLDTIEKIDAWIDGVDSGKLDLVLE